MWRVMCWRLITCGHLPRPMALQSSLWDSTPVPALITVAYPGPVALGLKFQSLTAGYITGIYFYKGPQNTGTHLGSLWTSTGTLLGSVTFLNETTSGWQYQALTNPVPIGSTLLMWYRITRRWGPIRWIPVF